MSKRSLAVVVGISAVMSCAAAMAQDTVPVTPVVELVGTFELQGVKASKVFRGGEAEWRPAEPVASRGLGIAITALFPPDASAAIKPPAMSVNYSAGGVWHKAPCIGVSTQNDLSKSMQWFLRDARGDCLSGIRAHGPRVEMSLLFEVPANISEVSLMYRGRAVLKNLPLPWK